MDKTPRRTRAAAWANAAMLALSLMLLAGFFGAFHPAFDSLGHFRMHLAVLSALLALPLLATSHRLVALSVLVFSLTAFSTASGAFGFLRLTRVEASFAAAPDDRATYRLLQMNLLYDNPTPGKVLSLIGRIKPDVITLEEVSQMWKPRLALLAGAYPHSIYCPYPNTVFGVAILSRRPFAAGFEAQCHERGAMAVARVDFSGTQVDVAALHLTWPWPFHQPWQIGAVSEPLAALSQNAVMGADCNATPWSAAVRRVAQAGKLSVVPSVGPTWLDKRLPEFLRFAGLPIDQLFWKGDIVIHKATRLESTGSDHLPVLMEFSIRPADKEPAGERQTAIAAARTTPAGVLR